MAALVDGATGGTRDQGTADEDLVRKAAAGDADAFDVLVMRYQDRVYSILARMCGSAEEAEDLAQETFLKAYRALGTFRQGCRFYTWLFRIAVNAAFSRRRHEMRRKSHETGHLDATGEGEQALRDVVPDPGNNDAAGRLEKEQLREQVQRGLAQLEPEHRSVVLLRDFEGLDYDAIADTLSISRAAVKSRLHRARQELARLLKGLRN